MKPNSKKIFVLICCLLFTLLFDSFQLSVAYAANDKPNKTVRVGFPQSKGLSESHEDGTYSGVFYDWYVEISKYTGWEYEFIVEDASDLFDMIKAGEIDLMGGMYYIPELESDYLYPHFSVGSANSLLIKRSDDNQIQGFDVSTLKGKTIGVFKNASGKIKQLEYFLSFNNLNCELQYFDDPDIMGQALDQGKIDLLLGGEDYLQEGRMVASQMGAEPYYIVTTTDSPQLFEQLDRAITSIYAADPNFADEVHASYFPTYYDNPLYLTEDDLEYIKNSPPIKVALLKDRYPLSYSRKEEQLGICQDTFQLISDQTGLKFDFVYADTYQNMLDLVASGQADIIGSFMDKEKAAQNMNMILTKNYSSLNEVILKNKKVSYPSHGLTLALVSGRSVPEGVEPEKISYYSNFSECINAIEQSEADITFIPSAFVEDLFYRNYYSQVTIVAFSSASNNISIAMPKPVNVPLFTILNKAVNSIPDKETDRIASRNLVSMGEIKLTLKSIIYTNPVAFIAILGSFLFLLFVLFLVYSRFKMKNQLILIKLQKAEESIQTKSEFLSQMSHEIRTPMNAIIGLTQIALQSRGVSSSMNKLLEQIQSSSQFLLTLVNDILDMSKIENSKMKLNESAFDPHDLIEQAESMMRVQAEAKNINIEFLCSLEDPYFIGDALRIKQILINLLSNALKFTEPGGKIVLSLSEINRKDACAQLRFSVKDNGIGIDKQDLDLIFHSFEQTAAARKTGQGTGLGLAISSNLVHLMGGELSVNSAPGQGSEFFFNIWLPIGQKPKEKQSKLNLSKYKLENMRILLAEDNDLNAEIVLYMLQTQNASVERAADGQEAVALFTSHPVGYYHLILMDIQMPIMSGLAATAAIRKMDRADAQTIPIIAMTANTFKEDQENAMNTGMNGFIPKPFNMEQLYEILEHTCEAKN